jgi:hypothetical protein
LAALEFGNPREERMNILIIDAQYVKEFGTEGVGDAPGRLMNQ